MDDFKQTIRKWNHDILTHMIGITYLMDMQRYPEADATARKFYPVFPHFQKHF